MDAPCVYCKPGSSATMTSHHKAGARARHRGRGSTQYSRNAKHGNDESGGARGQRLRDVAVHRLRAERSERRRDAQLVGL
eukprot:3516468-Pleurochrysis_carterae.AAC.1